MGTVPMGKKRIALYGGTFDPVHLGHLEVARTISRLFEIDELFFVLAQVAPHKILRPVTPALHRYAMLALATEDDPRLSISTFELEAPGRSYTVDTLAHFRSLWHDSADLFFIMGADSWSEVSTWREYERLLSLVNHIVVSRPGYELALGHMKPQLAARIMDLRGAGSERVAEIIRSKQEARIFITDAVMTDVSATNIRQAVRNKSELTSVVPAVVANYIGKYGLYRDSNGRNN
jgi:nicotinate-nucleotide adenylyltransferase